MEELQAHFADQVINRPQRAYVVPSTGRLLPI